MPLYNETKDMHSAPGGSLDPGYGSDLGGRLSSARRHQNQSKSGWLCGRITAKFAAFRYAAYTTGTFYSINASILVLNGFLEILDKNPKVREGMNGVSIALTLTTLFTQYRLYKIGIKAKLDDHLKYVHAVNLLAGVAMVVATVLDLIDIANIRNKPNGIRAFRSINIGLAIGAFCLCAVCGCIFRKSYRLAVRKSIIRPTGGGR